MGDPYRSQPEELFRSQIEAIEEKYTNLKKKFDKYKEGLKMDGDDKTTVLIAVIIMVGVIIITGYIGATEIIEELGLYKQKEAVAKCISKCQTSECKQDCVPPVTLDKCMNKCNEVFRNESAELQCVKLCFNKKAGRGKCY